MEVRGRSRAGWGAGLTHQGVQGWQEAGPGIPGPCRSPPAGHLQPPPSLQGHAAALAPGCKPATPAHCRARATKLLETTGASEGLGPAREQSLVRGLHRRAERTRTRGFRGALAQSSRPCFSVGREHQRASAGAAAHLSLLVSEVSGVTSTLC